MNNATSKIKRHFQRHDPVIGRVMQDLDFADWLKPRRPSDYFVDLCEGIICQQLSDKAGATIVNRFRGLFGKKKVLPQHVLAIRDESLRNVGMSWSKAAYVKNIAQAFMSQKLAAEELPRLSDEEIVAKLITIKGIGRWTAEMFLIFSLGRQDVFSYGDLGLRRGIEKLYGLTNPTREQIEKIIASWSPYRSYGCFALWHSLGAEKELDEAEAKFTQVVDEFVAEHKDVLRELAEK